MRIAHLVPVLTVLVASLAPGATVPGGIDITCEVPRTGASNFRTAASGQTSVKFKLWSAASGGSQLGSDYVVGTANLVVAKRYTEHFDSVPSRKVERINATIGDDGTPVLLPANGEAYLEVQVGTSIFGCDYGATGDPTARRRLQSTPFARESTHSETCETCTSATNGMIRAWVNFDGPTATIRAQYNVSSITHPSLGNFTINFTTPMPDANYAAQLTSTWNGATNQAVYPMIVSQSPAALTIYVDNGTSAYGPYDPSIVSVMILE